MYCMEQVSIPEHKQKVKTNNKMKCYDAFILNSNMNIAHMHVGVYAGMRKV